MSPSKSTNEVSVNEVPWTHFVRRSGRAGAAWMREYGQHRDLLDLNFQALLLLRRRRLEEGRALLAEYEARLGRAAAPGTSVRTILERYLFGVRGFYHYCREDWTAAERDMQHALRAVVRAIETDAFLLPQADSCHELILHRARISRNAGRWRDMSRHIETVRAMMSGDAPLCVLKDGTEIGYETLARFYRCLGELDEAARRTVEPMLTATSRLRLFERFVRRILAFPGFAIQYP